jgi:hypothetical protein
MRTVRNQQPKAADVEPGATVLWTNPGERSQLRTSFVALLLGAAAAGYAVAKNVKKKRRKR